MMFIRFLVLFLTFTFLTIINAQDENSNGTNCIDIHKCPEMASILRGPRLSAKALQTLSNSHCSFEEKIVPKICDNQETTTTTTTIVTQDSENIPNPPDVTNHLNLRLLDHVACGPVSKQKILNGKKTGIFDYPWMALITYNTECPFLCAGTIISSRYVLTAAHCVTSLKAGLRLIGVRVGDHDISKERDCEYDNKGIEVMCADRYQNFGIDDSQFHPDFNIVTGQNDIALIRLNDTVNFRPNVKPICLPFGTAATLNHRNAVVTGWGATKLGPHSPDLLQARLPLITNELCKEIIRNRIGTYIWHKQICAGGEVNVDSCNGDSGGPLQASGRYNGSVRMIQYGVVSYGLPRECCGTNGVPGVYTRVAYYMDWILDTMTD